MYGMRVCEDTPNTHDCTEPYVSFHKSMCIDTQIKCVRQTIFMEFNLETKKNNRLVVQAIL